MLSQRSGKQQQIPINLGAKTASPAISLRGQGAATPGTAPTLRNAIGQPVGSAMPKNSAGAEQQLPALQRSKALSAPVIHMPAAGSSGTARVNIANNRGSVNGTAVIRPAVGPPSIGGPAHAHYGINGTAVQSRH
jgi:hypothetical protein